MTKNLRPVKPKADGDDAGRLSQCGYCPAQVRWTKTASGKPIPCDPEVVWVRQVAHGEDALAHVEQVIIAWDQGSHTKGTAVRGVRCWEGREGALAGRIPHWATCPGKRRARADKDAKSAAQVESAQVEDVAQDESGALALSGSARGELACLLRDLLEEELERQGCVWTDTARGVQITRETRPEAGSVGALRIGRLCAAVRVVEGLEAGTWRARRSVGGGER